MEKQQFIFHSQSNSHSGVRVTVVGEYSTGILNLAVARCSEKDSFSRKIGREIAIERLNKGEIFYSFTSETMNSKRFYDIANAISKSVELFNTNVKIDLIEISKSNLLIQNCYYQASNPNSSFWLTII